jgi:hypothetical protein
MRSGASDCRVAQGRPSAAALGHELPFAPRCRRRSNGGRCPGCEQPSPR